MSATVIVAIFFVVFVLAGLMLVVAIVAALASKIINAKVAARDAQAASPPVDGPAA